MDAFQRVLAKSKVKLSHEIIADRMTLSDRIQEMTDVLREQKRIVFDDLFQGFYTRFDLIISFLAVLEMTKMRLMRIAQVDAYGSLHIEWCGGDDEELALADPPLAASLLEAVTRVAEQEGVSGSFRLVFNTGASAGQSVFHAHAHVLGGRDLQWPPG
jgi:hypothetical protein